MWFHLFQLDCILGTNAFYVKHAQVAPSDSSPIRNFLFPVYFHTPGSVFNHSNCTPFILISSILLFIPSRTLAFCRNSNIHVQPVPASSMCWRVVVKKCVYEKIMSQFSSFQISELVPISRIWTSAWDGTREENTRTNTFKNFTTSTTLIFSFPLSSSWFGSSVFCLFGFL